MLSVQHEKGTIVEGSEPRKAQGHRWNRLVSQETCRSLKGVWADYTVVTLHQLRHPLPTRRLSRKMSFVKRKMSYVKRKMSFGKRKMSFRLRKMSLPKIRQQRPLNRSRLQNHLQRPKPKRPPNRKLKSPRSSQSQKSKRQPSVAPPRRVPSVMRAQDRQEV